MKILILLSDENYHDYVDEPVLLDEIIGINDSHLDLCGENEVI